MTSLAGAASKDDILRLLRESSAEQNTKFFIGQLHEICFKKCITNPGSSMSRNDEACIANCVRKYVSFHDAVSKEWNSSIQRIQSSGGL